MSTFEVADEPRQPAPQPRVGKTRDGEEVYINETWKIEGGWEGYVLNRHGVAVLIFIPEN